MYNNIGLQTARGSGTNGYVQRNLSLLRSRKEKVEYHTNEDLAKLEQMNTKKPNQEILEHERKRQIELKCMELQDLMEDQGSVCYLSCYESCSCMNADRSQKVSLTKFLA